MYADELCQGGPDYSWSSAEYSYHLQASIIALAATVHRLVLDDMEETTRREEAGEPAPEIEIPVVEPGMELSTSDQEWNQVPGTVGVYLREQRRLVALVRQVSLSCLPDR